MSPSASLTLHSYGKLSHFFFPGHFREEQEISFSFFLSFFFFSTYYSVNSCFNVKESQLWTFPTQVSQKFRSVRIRCTSQSVMSANIASQLLMGPTDGVAQCFSVNMLSSCLGALAVTRCFRQATLADASASPMPAHGGSLVNSAVMSCLTVESRLARSLERTVQATSS